jgi:hypothetical protein
MRMKHTFDASFISWNDANWADSSRSTSSIWAWLKWMPLPHLDWHRAENLIVLLVDVIAIVKTLCFYRCWCAAGDKVV